MSKKKERRTPPPTLESIVHKSKVRMGEAEYKRSTDPENKKTENKKVAKANKGTEEAAPEVTAEAKTEAKVKQVSDKRLWSDSQVKALIVALIAHQDDRDAFVKAMKEVDSHARESDQYIYESGKYTEDQILSKATAVINQMKKDGVKVGGKPIKMPKKKKVGSVDFKSIYESIEGLTSR